MVKDMRRTKLFLPLALVSLAACQDASVPAANSGDIAYDAALMAAREAAEAGKPRAPISIEYEVVGNAVIGQPVLINVVVKSAQGPVDLSYAITDGSALMFQPGQVERVQIPDPSSGSRQQMAVVPQREGRVYVNVSAEVQTPGGSMIRSMAIPIRVGKAPEQATVPGEVMEAPDGETVISMPAEESNER